MLSLQEAESFAVEVLKVPYKAERVKNDPVSLLNEMIKTFHATIPFQDISLISVPAKERSMPSVEQIKEDVFAGRGGLCYTLNTFMKLFLEALGYAVHHIASTVRTPCDHIVTLVEIKENLFLVDVGCGYPTFEAIPVNFEEESAVYKHSFSEYKFVKSKETSDLIRLHHAEADAKMVNNKPVIDGWWSFYHIDLTPRSLDFFIESMTRVYTSAKATAFHTSLRLAVFPDLKMYGFKDKTQLVDNGCGALDSTPLTSNKVVQAVTDCFPMLHDELTAAIVNLGWD